MTARPPEVPVPERDRLPAYRHFPPDGKVSQADFEALLGHPTPSNTLTKGETATINTPLADLQHSFVARQLRKMVTRRIVSTIGENPESINAHMVSSMMAEAPLRTLSMFGGAEFNRGMAAGLLLMINRKTIRGLWQLLKARRQK